MALSRRLDPHVVARMGFGLLIVLCVLPLLLRSVFPDGGPAIEIETVSGEHQRISLKQMKGQSTLERAGRYQNQYGNWSDDASYTGVLLVDLIGSQDYTSVEIAADDGYAISVERWRVEDDQYPMVLAYRRDGIEVPDWEDGFSIAVLPMDGRVSNEEYGVVSAGSYWVKSVVRLTLRP